MYLLQVKNYLKHIKLTSLWYRNIICVESDDSREIILFNLQITTVWVN